MEITLSIDDEVVGRARLRTEALGMTVDQLVRQYLE
jgi:antitoxin component of RelBE/YafQ-DinJ toxin-antitoxin module